MLRSRWSLWCNDATRYQVSMKPSPQHVLNTLAQEIFHVYFTLVKIMLPAVVVVKILEMTGAIHWIALLISPAMKLVGLPDSLGIVWATTMTTNIYAGMVVFFDVYAEQPLTIAQISTLGAMMLMAHSLPIEGAVAKKVGIRWRVTLLTRIGSALLLGALLNWTYVQTDSLQQVYIAQWQPPVTDTSLLAWGISQLKMFFAIFWIIAALISLLKILRYLGIEKVMHWLMSPLLKLLGISKAASNITIIGLTLGLSFGGALLINEAQSGRLSRRDIFLSMSFLALCHSLIEDTLLVMLLGAHLSAILWARLLFTLVILILFARLLCPKESWDIPTWLMADNKN